MDVEFLATYNEIVNLRGKSIKERTDELIGIAAHPNFRDEQWPTLT